jgi:hypothetical protein
MKASDFTRPTTEGRNPAAEALVTKNDEKFQRGLTDYRKITIERNELPDGFGESKRATSGGLSYATDAATDAAFIARHFDPAMTCREAASRLGDRAFQEQVNNPNRSYWGGLIYFLASQPKDTRIEQVENRACLTALIHKTLAA